MMAIISQNYKKLFLALTLSLVVLFLVAKPAQAFIGTGIFDWAMSAMGGLADLGGWSFALFFSLFILLSLSTALVGIAAWLLEWSISLPINVMQNPIVNTGWNFTLGLANLSFILIFVFIALAFIFNRETLEMKKALPRLIIIALLVNFSLLFVGIFADIATIISNTIIQSAGMQGLASQTLSALTGGAGKLISSLVIMLGTSAVLLAIPFVDVITMIARIGVSLVYLPNLVTGFFLVFFNVVISTIYLLYSVLFVARVVVFWLLAIFAPLAFIAFILPATKKYWEDWFKMLLSWTFLGVIALLLVALGLKLIGALFAAGGGITINPLEGWVSLTKFIGYYFFLAVYLIIALIFSKKMAPKSAEFITKALEREGKTTGKVAGMFALGAAREIPAVNRAEAAIRRRLERVPGIGRALGGPGAYATELDKERKKAGKNLETMTPDEIRNVMQMRTITREDRLRKARGIELLAEKNLIENADKPYVPEALQFGVSQGTIYDKMPHWDPNITRRVEGMDVEEFRKNVRPEALRNADVFQAMDLRKVIDLGEKGRRAQKEALRTNVINNLAAFNAQIVALRATGNPDDARQAKKIEDMGNHIVSSPNYVT